MLRLAALLIAVAAAPAFAADLPAPPTFAADPNAAVAPDYWKGFYVGAGVSASVGKGTKGAWGSIGYAGYERAFDSGLTLGVQVEAGYNPWLTPGGRARGLNFTETDVKLGLPMGPATPYVFTGVALGKATAFAQSPLDPAASVNSLFAEPGALRAAGVFGVGVDYQLTDRLKIGVAGYVSQGGAAFPP